MKEHSTNVLIKTFLILRFFFKEGKDQKPFILETIWSEEFDLSTITH